MSSVQINVNRPPRAGEVYSAANATSVTILEVPATWKNRHVRFYTTGADIFLVVGDNSSISASNTANSTVASNKMVPAGNAAPKVAAANGYSAPYFFTTADTHFAIYASAATGNWQAHVCDHGPGIPR